MDGNVVWSAPPVYGCSDDKISCSLGYEYQTYESVNRHASGSSIRGQIADLINTDTTAKFAITQEGIRLSSIRLRRIPLGQWSVFDLNDMNELAVSEQDQCVDSSNIKTTAEKIEYIRDVFGLSISDLAKTLKKSRPSVYSWLEGDEPNEKTMQRIHQIYGIASDWSKKNQYHFSPGSMLRQPLGDMPSFFSLLEEEKLDLNKVKSGLVILLKLMQNKRDRMDRSKQRTKASSLSQEQKNNNLSGLTQSIGSMED